MRKTSQIFQGEHLFVELMGKMPPLDKGQLPTTEFDSMSTAERNSAVLSP